MFILVNTLVILPKKRRIVQKIEFSKSDGKISVELIQYLFIKRRFNDSCDHVNFKRFEKHYRMSKSCDTIEIHMSGDHICDIRSNKVDPVGWPVSVMDQVYAQLNESKV